MDISIIQKASDITGCSRYWRYDEVTVIVETASSADPFGSWN
jgi:hypothetical protein